MIGLQTKSAKALQNIHEM